MFQFDTEDRAAPVPTYNTHNHYHHYIMDQIRPVDGLFKAPGFTLDQIRSDYLDQIRPVDGVLQVPGRGLVLLQLFLDVILVWSSRGRSV